LLTWAPLVPKDKIMRGSALSTLPQDKQIVIYGKTGMGSAETLAAAMHAASGTRYPARTVSPPGSTRSMRTCGLLTRNHRSDAVRHGDRGDVA
jgi:hypothetical protein